MGSALPFRLRSRRNCDSCPCPQLTFHICHIYIYILAQWGARRTPPHTLAPDSLGCRHLYLPVVKQIALSFHRLVFRVCLQVYRVHRTRVVRPRMAYHPRPPRWGVMLTQFMEFMAVILVPEDRVLRPLQCLLVQPHELVNNLDLAAPAAAMHVAQAPSIKYII